ncbi:HNH endonuclease [Citrobacter portucalensis]|uniref:HNH endonuclease n=1 Tax=Citrobacter portucalensis TaxID=1639133 RepID=UPI0022DF6C7E|nr:HNH endonuclease [Citrobacter portucalensis]MEB1055683.1 HNH endonuclease [Citrobacter portucalensis]
MSFFTCEEKEIISECILNGHLSWGDEKIKDLKAKIKEELKTRQRNVCCYCLRSFHGEFNYVIDIEHILPKHKFVNRMFDLDNLAASCKRCNMKIKGRRVDFLSDTFHDDNEIYSKDDYLFIHPNLDVFESHISYTHNQKGRDIIVRYDVLDNSNKGIFSHNFFKLEKLSVHTYNVAQGIYSDEDEWLGDPDLDDNEEDIAETFSKIESCIGDLILEFAQ